MRNNLTRVPLLSSLGAANRISKEVIYRHAKGAHLLCANRQRLTKMLRLTVGGRQEERGHVPWDGDGCNRGSDPLEMSLVCYSCGPSRKLGCCRLTGGPLEVQTIRGSGPADHTAHCRASFHSPNREVRIFPRWITFPPTRKQNPSVVCHWNSVHKDRSNCN